MTSQVATATPATLATTAIQATATLATLATTALRAATMASTILIPAAWMSLATGSITIFLVKLLIIVT